MIRLKLLFSIFFCVGHLQANPLFSLLEGWSDEKETCGYVNCPVYNPNALNVHIVPHSHDDVGWLKTVDQYYFGEKDYIQVASVQNIYDSVYKALKKNHERRFVAVEMAFFTRWWQDQSETVKAEVKAMVERGQLEFVGGGWSMNDEAASYYSDIIDQMTFGQKFINDTFGECGRARTVWPLDPFGHSREQASLFAQMGYDAMFFARLDWREKGERRANKAMEFVWEAGSEGDDFTSIFGGALNNHYSAPSGYCFDVFCSRDSPIVDDPESPEYNVQQRVDGFLKYVQDNKDFFQGNNFLVLMGDDFQYQFAHNNYKNMDKLIKHINERTPETGIVAYYSSPACYAKARNDEILQWPVMKHDFFPYANDPHAYWTGYFTSRPSQKRIIREAGTLLQACKQLEVLAGDFSPPSSHLEELMTAQGINQHHDAVTGTEKQAVTSDYVRITHDAIQSGYQSASDSMKAAFSLPDQTFCNKLNVSECSVIEAATSFAVSVYNQLSTEHDFFVRIPVTGNSYVVSDGTENIMSQVIQVPDSVKALAERSDSAAGFELVFKASQVPPMGLKVFHVATAEPGSEGASYLSTMTNDLTASISNNNLALHFEDGNLILIEKDGQQERLEHGLYFYYGAIGNNNGFENRASGAYIFRPRYNNASLIGSVTSLTVIEGPLVNEVWQEIEGEWASHIFRLYEGSELVETEWQIGPIPVISDFGGKEVISRYSTDISSVDTFYTDSNGRQTLERLRDSRPTFTLTDYEEPVSGNYYPINSHLYIQDEAGKGFVVVNDRAQGGTSLESGQIELMIHRRCLMDDAFGVGEALNEEGYDSTENGLVARGKHWFYFKFNDLDSTLARQYRKANLLVNKAPLLGFSMLGKTKEEVFAKYPLSKSGMRISLPENVQLLTLEPWREGEAIIRLEHLYEEEEDIDLSQPVTFNLEEIFESGFFTTAEELSLSANQKAVDMKRLQWTRKSGTSWHSSRKPINSFVTGKTELTLNPMDIRTFVLKK